MNEDCEKLWKSYVEIYLLIYYYLFPVTDYCMIRGVTIIIVWLQCESFRWKMYTVYNDPVKLISCPNTGILMLVSFIQLRESESTLQSSTLLTWVIQHYCWKAERLGAVLNSDEHNAQIILIMTMRKLIQT